MFRNTIKSLFGLSLAAGLFASCQSTSSDPVPTGPMTAFASFNLMKDSSRIPDSADWTAGKQSGRGRLSCVDFYCTDTLSLSDALGSEKVQLKVYKLGIQIATFVYTQEGRSSNLTSAQGTSKNETNLSLLSSFFKLRESKTDSFSKLGTLTSANLVAYYATLVYAKTAGIPKFPDSLPNGMSVDSVQENLVFLASRAGESWSQIAAEKWGLDSTTVRTIMMRLVGAGELLPSDTLVLFPLPPVRILHFLTMDSVDIGGGAVVGVKGEFSWNKGLTLLPSIEIHTSKGTDNIHFHFPTSRYPSTDTSWLVDGNLFLQVDQDAPTGIDTLVITLKDGNGHLVAARVEFNVVERGSTSQPADSSKPTLSRGEHTDDTVVWDDVSSLPVSWKVSDNALKSVKIEGVAVQGAAGVFSRTIELVGSEMVVHLVAIDSSDNQATDSICVRKLAVPRISPDGGSFFGTQTVTVTAAGADSIQTSRDSSIWSKYGSAITLSATTKLYARAFKGGVVSRLAVASFTSSAVPVPTISPNGGTFYTTQSVVVTAVGADSIQISTDSIAWTTYASAVPVSTSEKVYARAFKGGIASSVVVATFAISGVPAPSFSPNGGTVSTTQAITVSATGVDSIQTSPNGTSGWTKYATALHVASSQTLYARAFKAGVTSTIVSAAFAVPVVPTVLPKSGGYSATVLATATNEGVGTIEYALGAPSGWKVYGGSALSITSNAKLYVRAVLDGVASEVVEVDYAFAPVLALSKTPDSGAVTADVGVTATGTFDDIEFATDTSSATANWATLVGGSIPVSKARVFARCVVGSSKSPIASLAVHLYPKQPTVWPASGGYGSPQYVLLPEIPATATFQYSKLDDKTTWYPYLNGSVIPVLVSGTLYLRATSTTGDVTESSAQYAISTALWNSDIAYDTARDHRDGRTYRSVRIGTQTWLAENLAYDTLAGVGSWCKDDKPTACTQYGRLYTWQTAMAGASGSDLIPSGQRGLCPQGWHVPSDGELNLLSKALGGAMVSGQKTKSKYGWSGSSETSDSVGFRALPAGSRNTAGYYSTDGTRAAWWAATEDSQTDAWTWYIAYDSPAFDSDFDSKGIGMSVRCLKN
jgi:uncharacterized protein (TIGR02145 family)